MVVTKPGQPKLHHEIARSYAKRFLGPKGIFYCYDKKRPLKGVYPALPASVFAKNHLYSFVEEDGAMNAKYETEHFAPLDGDGNRIIGKMVDAVRRGELPNLSPNDRRRWNEFYYFQWKRLSDVMAATAIYKLGDEGLEEVIADLQQRHGPISESELAALRDPAKRERLKRKAFMDARVMPPSSEISDLFASRGLVFAHIKAPNKSFIIGGFPFVRMGPVSNLWDQRVELWLPIARDIVVTPFGDDATSERVIPPSDHQVRTINESIFRNSTVVASPSLDLLTSLMTRFGIVPNLERLAQAEAALLKQLEGN